MDVIQRVEPVIIEMERERECVCIVAHQAVLRAIYGYLMDIPQVRPGCVVGEEARRGRMGNGRGGALTAGRAGCVYHVRCAFGAVGEFGPGGPGGWVHGWVLLLEQLMS